LSEGFSDHGIYDPFWVRHTCAPNALGLLTKRVFIASRIEMMSSSEASTTNLSTDLLYRQHGKWLVAFLSRQFGRQAAEDLAQEAYVRIVGARVEIRNPRAFLARVALRAARDVARQKANRLPVCEADERDAPTLPNQIDALFFKQAVLALPHELRAVFLLSRFAGLTNAEIAQRCGISVKRVEARMTKARARFAALMRD
jgi:RNA polymerase sigma-70 factor (ECF subfamily)